MADLGLTERATKSETVRKQHWNLRLVVSVPDVGVEAFYDRSNVMASLKWLTFDVTGRRRPKAGANLQAQLAGGPVDGGVGHRGYFRAPFGRLSGAAALRFSKTALNAASRTALDGYSSILALHSEGRVLEDFSTENHLN